MQHYLFTATSISRGRDTVTGTGHRPKVDNVLLFTESGNHIPNHWPFVTSSLLHNVRPKCIRRPRFSIEYLQSLPRSFQLAELYRNDGHPDRIDADGWRLSLRILLRLVSLRYTNGNRSICWRSFNSRITCSRNEQQNGPSAATGRAEIAPD